MIVEYANENEIDRMLLQKRQIQRKNTMLKILLNTHNQI